MADTLIHDGQIKRARQLTRRARLMLIWERYIPVFALPIALWLIFFIAAFAGVWERIGDPWRLIALILSVWATARAIWQARDLKLPTLSEARRRVEADNNVSHRPLDTIEDQPALGQEAWDSHYESAQSATKQLKPSKGRGILAALDRYKIRYAVVIGLVLSLMIGTTASFERLRMALSPTWLSASNPAKVSFEAWVDPPDYTGRPPIYFKDSSTITVPAGSEIVARISGLRDPARPRLIEPGLSRRLKLITLGNESYEARTQIQYDSTVEWRVGNRRQRWAMEAVTDTPPTVSLNDTPKADKRDRLAMNYSLEDDYGVERLELVMQQLVDDPAAAPPDETVKIALSGRPQKSENVDLALDLSKHVWAGKKVSAYLQVFDGLGQTARSQTVYFTVPDKIFVEPLAKAIIEQRSLVLAGQADYRPPVRKTRKEWENSPYFDTFEPELRLNRAPVTVQRAALLIDTVTDVPRGVFKDPAIYMGLKNVLYRLRYAREQTDLDGVSEDLWNIALRAEFGVLGTALEEMRKAEQALRDAMARRAPQREIDTLFERYNESVDRYKEELIREAIKNGNMAEGGDGGGGGGIDADEIQKLLDAIEEANRLGDTEGARKALSQLAELLENMEVQLSQGGGGGGGIEGEMSEEMKKSLEELADLLGEQRELKDETEQAEREMDESSQAENQGPGESQSGTSPDGGDKQAGGLDGQNGPAPTLSPDDLARQQKAIEDMLDDLAENLDEAERSGGLGADQADNMQGGAGSEDGTDEAANLEQSLEDAIRAMQDSRALLEGGALGEAAEAQADAIRALREAGQSLAARTRGRQRGEGEDADANGDNDPLGRQGANGGIDDKSKADLEQKDNATRSRELLEELRRRASEQSRQQEEREYLDRLLDQF